jgi:SAM-dependent methyltransferase
LAEGVIPSPNIWDSPDAYELENRAFDRDGAVWAAMADVRSWAEADVLDVGCGSGFHLPFLARTARTVVGVEPHPPLVAAARRRVARLGLGRTAAAPPDTPGFDEQVPSANRVEVRTGTAQALPVADASVDVAHARWAYFFGPGCEPGLAELDRVVRRGGTAYVIDNDPTRSTFGSWFRRGYPDVDPPVVERFWSTRGWTRIPVDMRWSFTSRADLESVVRIEFSREVADEVLAGHEGTEVDYAVNVWWKGF